MKHNYIMNKLLFSVNMSVCVYMFMWEFRFDRPDYYDSKHLILHSAWVTWVGIENNEQTENLVQQLPSFLSFNMNIECKHFWLTIRK